MSPEDINISHKIKSKGVGLILVKFQSHKAKSRLYKARTKLKNIRVTDVYPNASTAARVMVGQGRIFINENLRRRETTAGKCRTKVNTFRQ